MNIISNHAIIDVFSRTWWMSIIFTAIFIGIIIMFSKNANENIQKTIAKFIGYLLIFLACFIHVYQLTMGEWVLQSSLPLNLCSISGILSGFVLLFPSQLAFEFLLFWGIPGAFHSFITPELTLGNRDWYFYDYYLMHGGIILSVVYLSAIFKFKPRMNSWLWVFAWTQVLLPIVYFIDNLVGANYMYLMNKPIANNPLVIGDWPCYLLVFELAALIHVYIVYLIFKKRITWVDTF
jgi:hypothetical integral membrane protein (TIGR02206 family)